MQHEGDQRRQRQAVCLRMLPQHLRHVAEEAQRHQRVHRRLMLKQQVEQDLTTGHSHRVKQIGVGLLETLPDERGRLQCQRAPVRSGDDALRQMPLEEGGSKRGIGKHVADKGVMRVSGELLFEIIHVGTQVAMGFVSSALLLPCLPSFLTRPVRA